MENGGSEGAIIYWLSSYTLIIRFKVASTEMFSKLFGITTKSFLFDVTSHTHLATCMGINWLKLTSAPPMGHVCGCITSCMVDVRPYSFCWMEDPGLVP